MATEIMEKLAQQLAAINGEITALEAAVEAENRTMTDEEIKKNRDLNSRFDTLNAEIELRRRTEARQASLAVPQPTVTNAAPAPFVTQTPAPTPGATTYSGGTPVAHNFANHGFSKGPGEYLVAVFRAGTDGFRDPRLMVNTVSTFGGEGVPGDGGFALPPQFVAGIMDAVMPEDSFLRAMNPVQTNSSVLVVPKNEKAPWSTSGVTSAATAEGAAITASKPAIGETRVTLYKAASLVHVSEESLSDIPFLSTWVMSQMGEHLRFQLEDWVINGTGEGQPLGILNSAALIALSDADSTATAIGAVDVLTMEASLIAGGTAFYLGNPTVLPAIQSMKTGSAGQALVQPDMTIPAKQALLGRPFYRSEACPILNSTGDLLLIQPRGYLLALKAGGVQTATTVGFAFDQDLQSFKATLRVGGAPLLSTKLARAKSASSYISHFVAITGNRS